MQPSLTEPFTARAGATLTEPYAQADEADALPLVVTQCERFLAREVRSEQFDTEACIPRATLDAAASVGLFGLSLPEESGGLGLSLKSTCYVIQCLARVDRAIAITVGLHAGLGTRGLVRFGSEALKREWLPRLASGEAIAAFAATEPGAGSDLHSIRTTIESRDGALALDGEKAYVTNGGFASVFTVLARSPGIGGARAHSLAFVPRDRGGVEPGLEEHKLGIRGSSTVPVRFDNVRLEMGDLLDVPGRGMDQAHEVLSWGRTLMSAGCVGTAEAALTAAMAYTASRKQFGRPIAAFGATRAHLCDMAATVYAMESVVRETGDVEACGGNIGQLSIIAKVLCSEGAFDVCDRSIQLHGAAGFIEGTGVARMMRDARVTRIFEGANDVLLVRLGASLVAARRDATTPLTSSRDLRGLSQSIDALTRRLEGAITWARKTYGVRAVNQQLLLQRLARAEIALHTATACATRAAAESRADATLLGKYASERSIEAGTRALDEVVTSGRDEDVVNALAELLFSDVSPARVVKTREAIS